MDNLDRQLLNELQSNFPLVSNPFAELGQRVGLEEAQVLSRIEHLKKNGIIRRIGASFSSKNLGFASSLIAVQVPEGCLAQVVDVVNSYPGVTHNYRRNHQYNLWFTLIAPSEQELEETFQDIQQRTGNYPFMNLPATRMFKIKAEFAF